jgi:hypothetical protein
VASGSQGGMAGGRVWVHGTERMTGRRMVLGLGVVVEPLFLEQMHGPVTWVLAEMRETSVSHSSSRTAVPSAKRSGLEKSRFREMVQNDIDTTVGGPRGRILSTHSVVVQTELNDEVVVSTTAHPFSNVATGSKSTTLREFHHFRGEGEGLSVNVVRVVTLVNRLGRGSDIKL